MEPTGRMTLTSGTGSHASVSLYLFWGIEECTRVCLFGPYNIPSCVVHSHRKDPGIFDIGILMK